MLPAIDPRTPGIRLQANGITFHCIEAGPKEGPLVVLLHGFPEFWWGWRHQIEPLARAGFHVLVPDQRGYHLSDKPEGRRAYDLDILAQDLDALSEALGYTRCTLVGHDWGGLVAWWTASRYPERIERLVVLNAPHPTIAGSYLRRHPSQMLRSLYIGLFQIPYLPEAMLAANNHQALKRTLLRTSRAGTFSENDLAEYEKAWAQKGALTAMLNWYRALPLRPPHRLNEKLLMPVLALWGMRDRFLEFGLCEESLALCVDKQVRRFETASHWLHLEEAGLVNDILLDFMKA